VEVLISFSFYIDPNKEMRKVYMIGVSVALKVSLILNELTAIFKVEMDG
jgi:hypothetical protein